ncbi:MAG: TerB family tellurite resistance protein [Planctomycetota bacterium]
MTSSELVQYLANVIHVVRADNQLTPAEQTAFAGVVAELGAKKKEQKDAERLAAQDEFQARPVSRYSDQIRNVEDMVYLALADGDLEQTEKARVVHFARDLGLTQDQVNRIVSEAKNRVAAQSSLLACSKCAANCQATAKFCPECGAAMQGQPQPHGTRLEFEYPKSGVAIEFAETTAATFDAALRAAKAAPLYQEIERSKKRWLLAAWPTGNAGDALDVVANLKGVRNRKVYIEGAAHPWDEVFGFLSCSEQRGAAYKPAEYCFGADEKRPNLWGCKQLCMDWVQWAEWFTYGKWVGKDTFEFDKDRITHELETNSHRLRFCPHLRRDLLQAVLQLLPGRVRVSDREGWKYKESYEQTPNSINIVQKTTKDGFSYKNEFFTDGVAPLGFDVAKGILKRAFAQCGITDVDVRAILP